jgi:tetratricopeptide (TPR) repeat protein
MNMPSACGRAMPLVLSNRGVTLHKLRRLEEALASHDAALASRPDYAEALTNRGVALYDLKRFDEALASYDSGDCAASGRCRRAFFQGPVEPRHRRLRTWMDRI